MRAALAALFTLFVAIPFGSGSAVSAPPDPPGKPVTVMTRNLYIGGDIMRPLKAAYDAQEAGATPAEIVQALAVATDVTRKIVDATNFPVRAQLLAGEISRTRPDLVGLQEVALWRSGPLELDKVGVPNATTVDYDFLSLLLAALAADGTPYEPVVVGTRADIEGPSFTPTFQDPRDVRLTVHDVILRRADTDSIRVLATGDTVYDVNLPVNIVGINLDFARGYEWADVRMGSTSFRFVNTHLEAFSSDIALAQAMQVVNEATATDRPTVFVCDCNSDPLNSTVKPDDSVPHYAAYRYITGEELPFAPPNPTPYTDEWLQWAPAEEGWTSGLSELVNDPTAAGFDHRIDMVFAHSADGSPITVDRGRVTGTKVSDRDPATGLWPSDHGGVVLRLRGL